MIILTEMTLFQKCFKEKSFFFQKINFKKEGHWFESRLPWGRTELHVEVSLSMILNPKIAPDVQLAPCVATSAISAMSRLIIQGIPWPSPIELNGFCPSNHPLEKKEK